MSLTIDYTFLRSLPPEPPKPLGSEFVVVLSPSEFVRTTVPIIVQNLIVGTAPPLCMFHCEKQLYDEAMILLKRCLPTVTFTLKSRGTTLYLVQYSLASN
jgi:hypothetical protein